MNPAFARNRCQFGACAGPAVLVRVCRRLRPRGDVPAERRLFTNPQSAGPDRGAALSAARWWALSLTLACYLLGSTRADDYILKTGYENRWFSPGPPAGPYTNYFGASASTVFYGGHVLGNSTNTLPTGGNYGLESSAFGQPVEGIQSDVALGDLIVGPAGTDPSRPPANFVPVRAGDNTNAYYQSPDGGAFWVPSTEQVIAAQPNNVTIDWITTTGTTNRQVLNVDAVPRSRPARLFWTESPYDAPAVSLEGLFPVIHYNSQVRPPTYQYVTNASGGITTVTSNVVAGVWLDDQKQLRAVNASGTFLLEYYEEGTYSQQVQPVGVEVVQVLPPDVQVVDCYVGARLLPVDLYWAQLDSINGVIPNVTTGLNDTVYVHSQTGPKNNWAFAIKRTWQEPWSLQIYWQHRGIMGVLWPYEVDWYSCDWPPYPQRYVVGDAPPADTAPVLIPAELSAELMEDMDPPLHASLSVSGRSFSTTQPGTCLLKYTTHDNVWFEVVQTVSHTNEVYFDLEPREWPIGEELTPADPNVHALRFDGVDDYVEVSDGYFNHRDNWTLSLWFNTSSYGPVLYTEAVPGSMMLMRVQTQGNGQLSVGTWNDVKNAYTYVTTPTAVVQTNHWHHLTLTYADGSDTNGTLRLYLDDYTWETTGLPRVNHSSASETVIGAYSHYGTKNYFAGKLDQVRVWDRALTSDEIRNNRYVAWPGTADRLIANFPFNEGQGEVVHNLANDHDGTVFGGPVWGYGQFVPLGKFWAGFPGYLHAAEGDRYNINRYHYPTEAEPDASSYVFAVNAGELEVWWANRSRQIDMPAVYYPSQVSRYTNVWPTSPKQIVIASGLGSSGNSLLSADDALSFNGTPTNYVTAPSDPALDVGNELTVEAWVNLSNPGGNQKIVSRMNTVGSAYSGFVLGVYQNAVDVEFWTGSGTTHSLYNQGTVPTNLWTHIAYTFKAFSTNSVVVYVNGQPVYTNYPAINEGIRASTSALYIGRASWSTAMNTLGAIGEVRIWNVARSAAELQATWRTRLNGDEAGLVAYYPFVHGTDSSVLTDAGPFGLHGTLSGATWTGSGRPVEVPGPLIFGSPSVYVQNDPNLSGYNPNEEHALMMGGVAYALRNDLNQSGSTTYSEPFVLVDYLDPDTGHPRMMPFIVVATNELYSFDRDLVAGLPIEPIMPLGVMPLCTNTYSLTQPPAWRDRKAGWWAISAGDDGGTATAEMHFYYQMQPTFYFPALPASQQPSAGTEMPWLPSSGLDYNDPLAGTPVTLVYHLTWPDAPKLHLGQTLTKAASGLPEIWGQLSVEVLYQQSERRGLGASVDLFDPVVAHGADLDSGVINAMISSQLARRDTTSSLVRFPNLPPSLYPRLYYDPNRGARGQLVLEGQYEETLTGSGYLLLNLLEPFEQTQVRDTAIGIDASLKTAWDNAVNALPTAITTISPNVPYVHAALGARLTSGAGYVTLTFNNSTNAQQVPPALPVSLAVIQVDTNLYSGELEVIQPGDVLAEQLSLRYSADFAGHVGECDFRWRWVEPAGGLIPNTNFYSGWITYGADPTPGTNEVTIAGASPFTLSDHYFAVQYRPHNPIGPSGTNWSAWTYNLAPGWVKRVMNGINPFMQMQPDMTANPVDPRLTMISQAGGPYEGDIALNMDAAQQAGLIPTYETVFNRAMDFSLRAGLSDASLNETLLFAASRLHDLYMLLGNEAFADAQDPTIAFPQELSTDTHGASATSIFPFMNQEPNLLEEELALLRGRDDTLSPPVTTSPVYNRLIWNFTAGINGGEPAYAYNYNLRGDPNSTEGTITAEDAKRLYPQGHGDAWGHYLSAIQHYYDLLSYTNFVWHTEPSATPVGNAAVSTDFFDEQKFAETAAARARTGAAIVKQTFRERYSEDPTGRWPGYTDSNTNRAWGLGDWASRAGQAAYYDWAVANSLLLDTLTNMTQVGGQDVPPQGIQKIDRASTPELREIAASFRDIQAQVDSADGGLNPLGLARNVVPFDIDPSGIDAGKTHFEQVYDRALQALYNACVAFDQARGTTLQLHKQFDSVYDLEEALAKNETDYKDRLIQLYGYPYSDDIGPTGAYPQGYDGPDLINWQILDLDNLLVNAPTGQVMQVEMYTLGFDPKHDWNSLDPHYYEDLATNTMQSNYIGQVTVCLADNGLRLKPDTWVGQRRAQGELQLALSEYVQQWYALQAKMADYAQNLYSLEVEIEHRQADYKRIPSEWAERYAYLDNKRIVTTTIESLKVTKDLAEAAAEGNKGIIDSRSDAITSGITGIAGLGPAEMTVMDFGKIASLASKIASWTKYIGAHALTTAIGGAAIEQAQFDHDWETLLQGNTYKGQLRWPTLDTEVKLQGQEVKQAELLAAVQALEQSQQRITKLVAEGDRLVFERAQVRARAAQRIQSARYGDLAFRIFRDDALRRYQEAFNLAARYTYLAAKAYDYETGLLYSDTDKTPGSKFLEDVVRARAPGRFYVWLGEPMTGGGVGEPGLADVLARMKADWNVAKGRFGFNNPDTETSRFSLRTELYRISPSASGDAAWQQVLENCKVADLHDLPEFVRYCRPYTDATNVEPALVIPFSTFVIAGQNFFGLDLAAGDNAYDASHAATKVRSAGVWFTGFNTTFNTNATGPGLANEPRVYLLPVGEDVLRSPTRNALQLRHWQVFDQAIPLPYNVGGADVDGPDWIPLIDSLREPLAQMRRFASFRAYHDSGQFDSAETCNNGRLVGRSVWNTRWLLIIPGRTLLADAEEGIERFIYGAKVSGLRDGNGIKDIKIFFQTYSVSGD